MKLRPATIEKLERNKHVLAREFETVPFEEIAAEVEAVASALAARARFDDYIPTLVHRYTRDELRSRRPAGALLEAA